MFEHFGKSVSNFSCTNEDEVDNHKFEAARNKKSFSTESVRVNPIMWFNC